MNLQELRDLRDNPFYKKLLQDTRKMMYTAQAFRDKTDVSRDEERVYLGYVLALSNVLAFADAEEKALLNPMKEQTDGPQ